MPTPRKRRITGTAESRAAPRHAGEGGHEEGEDEVDGLDGDGAEGEVVLKVEEELDRHPRAHRQHQFEKKTIHGTAHTLAARRRGRRASVGEDVLGEVVDGRRGRRRQRRRRRRRRRRVGVALARRAAVARRALLVQRAAVAKKSMGTTMGSWRRRPAHMTLRKSAMSHVLPRWSSIAIATIGPSADATRLIWLSRV